MKNKHIIAAVLAIALVVVVASMPVYHAQAQTGGSSSATNTGGSGSGTNTGGSGSGTNTGGSNGGGTFYLQNPLSSRFNSVGGLVQGALEIFSYVAVLIGVLMLIWTGFKFVLAQGNPDKMKELKSWLMWIVIGIAIVIGARIIVSIVINTLSATRVVSQPVIDNANNALNGASPTH